MNSKLPTHVRTLIQLNRNVPSLTLTSEPIPVPSTPEEYLVKVHAFSPFSRELALPALYPQLFQRPLVPGYDVAGVIAQTPPSSTPSSNKFKLGDEVYARTAVTRRGVASEYAIALSSELALKPTNLSFVEAASVPMSAETAWQALFAHGNLPGLKSLESGGGSEGKKVFVINAGGGVGLWIVQLANFAGAEVSGSTGTALVDLVKEKGATEVVDYRKQGLKQWGEEKASERQYDLVIDCVGGDQNLSDAWYLVKDGGTFLSIVGDPNAFKPASSVAQNTDANVAKFFIVEPNGTQLEQVTQLIEGQKLTTLIDSVWKFEEFEEAYTKVDGGRVKGKVVISTCE